MRLISKWLSSSGLLSRRFWFFMLSLSVWGLATTMLRPFLPVYMNENLGLSVGAISLLYFVAGLLGTFTPFPAGWLSDRIGRKSTYSFGNLGAFIIPILLTRIRTFEQLLPVLSLSDVMDATQRTAQTTIIADLVDEKKRNTAYGVQRIVGNMAWVIAPILGALVLTGISGFQELFLISAILGVVSLVLYVLLVPESRRAGLEKPSLPNLSLLGDRALLVLCVASLFSMLFYVQLYTLLPIFARQTLSIGQLEVGLLFSVSGVTVVLLQLPTSAFTERVSGRTGYILGVVIMAIGITEFAFAPSFYWLLVGVVIMTIGENMFFPIASALVTAIAPAAQRGTYVGIFSLFLSAGAVLSPLLGGGIWQATGNAYLPWLMSPLYAAISVGLALYHHDYEEKTVEK